MAYCLVCCDTLSYDWAIEVFVKSITDICSRLHAPNSGATSGHTISGTSIGGTTFSNMNFIVDLDLLFQNMTLVLQFPAAS